MWTPSVEVCPDSAPPFNHTPGLRKSHNESIVDTQSPARTPEYAGALDFLRANRLNLFTFRRYARPVNGPYNVDG